MPGPCLSARVAESLPAQLPVIALVGFYPTNKLLGRRPILERKGLCPNLLVICPKANDIIGNYPSSIRLITVLYCLAMPVSKAGYLRVTHPFAADHRSVDSLKVSDPTPHIRGTLPTGPPVLL